MADVITLNEIDEVKNLVGINNTEDANGTLSQKSTAIFNFVKSRIGAPTDGGGTTQQGSVMAKLNAVLNQNLSHGTQTFTSSGTWTCPEGVGVIYVTASGGAGGGGGGGGGHKVSYSSNYHSGGGGGGSGSVPNAITAIIPVAQNTSYTITIGAGGQGGAGGAKGSVSNTAGAAGSSGKAGGDTKFGNVLTAKGGFGGNYGRASSTNAGSSGFSNASSTTSISSVATTSVLISVLGGASGKAGATSKAVYTGTNDGYGACVAGGAGGSAVTGSPFGIKSGAGGAGGNTSTDYATSFSYSDGSTGSSGGAGKMVIVW